MTDTFRAGTIEASLAEQFAHKRKDGSMTYQTLKLCANLLINCDQIIKVGDDYIPLEINFSPAPSVRIRTQATDGTFPLIVDDNRQLATEVSVSVEPSRIEIFFLDKRMLTVRFNDFRDVAVTYLDLRPIGLEIRGTDYGGLFIGSTNVKNLAFTELENVIAIR